MPFGGGQWIYVEPNITGELNQNDIGTLTGDPDDGAVPANASNIPVDFSCTVNNDMSAAGVIVTAKLQEKIGGGDWFPIETLNIAGPSGTLTKNNHTVSIGNGGPTYRYRVEVTDNIQTEPETKLYSNELAYNFNPYEAPQIVTPQASPVEGFFVQRQGEGGAHLSTRYIYDGNSTIAFKIRKNQATVDLDRLIITRNGTTVHNEDISGLSQGQTGDIEKNIDDNYSASTGNENVEYKVYIWDAENPYPGSGVSGSAANETKSYNVRYVECVMVAHPSTNSFASDPTSLQPLLDYTASGKRHVITEVANSDWGSVTDDLNVVFNNSGQISLSGNHYVYVFIPSIFFNWDSAPGQEITGASNTNSNIEWINDDSYSGIYDYSGAHASNSLSNGQPSAGVYILATNVQLSPPSFASSAEKIPYLAFRYAASQGSGFNIVPVTITNQS